MKQDRANRRQIVLLGVGHTNAHVVRMWAMQRLTDTDLTCVSDSGVATYSGFLPAVLAGQLTPEAMEIDLVRLCAAAEARLITERVTGLDREHRQLLFADRPPVAWDVLSIGIGSVPQMPAVGADSPALIPIKPMRSLIERLRAAVERCPADKPRLEVVIVGGGAAGVEVTQCLPHQLKQLTSADCHITLVNRNDNLLPGCRPGTIRRVRRLIEQRGRTIRNNSTVVEIRADSVLLQDGEVLSADIVIWAATADPPPLLTEFDLPKDDQGFLLTRDTLLSVNGDPVFAVGDTGTIENQNIPRAGVYAVRQGPVLWDNIQRHLEGRSLVSYRPQTSFLKLLNMGDGRAVGEWRGLSFVGRWAMRLKQRIDQTFMDKYQQLPDQMSMPDDMPCRGCGCKLAGDVLSSALIGDEDTVRDDATLISASEDKSAVQTSSSILVSTDFFSAPFPDAWLTGRVAAVHAASDIHAMGAAPFAAEAIVVLPDGDEVTQRRMLSDFQAGAAAEFQRMGAVITGGHTITGPRWEVGFTVFGRPLGDRLIRKQGLVAGDRLFLTQPLGSGVLMAALMRGQCRQADFHSMRDVMLGGHQDAAQIAVDCGVIAGTDVTGFGLLGHLQEMLTEDTRAILTGDSIPLMAGTKRAAEQGIASTLLPSNRRYLKGVRCARQELQDLLLDPQTCGGLLLAVSCENSEEFQRRFAERSLPLPTEIGVIAAAEADAPRITVQ